MINRVLFDIGHGTDTAGKGVSGFREHDWNSAVAIRARELAEYNGFEVVFSQQPYSKEVPSSQRISFINSEHKKKFFICAMSFHANAGGNASGHDVFYWHSSKEGKRLATIWNKYANKYMMKQHGQGIWASVPNTWTDFWFCRLIAPVSIIMEHFYYTNPAELKKCNTPEYIEKCAKVAVMALCEYVGKPYKEPVKAPSRSDDNKQSNSKKEDKDMAKIKELEKQIEELNKQVRAMRSHQDQIKTYAHNIIQEIEKKSEELNKAIAKAKSMLTHI